MSKAGFAVNWAIEILRNSIQQETPGGVLINPHSDPTQDDKPDSRHLLIKGFVSHFVSPIRIVQELETRPVEAEVWMQKRNDGTWGYCQIAWQYNDVFTFRRTKTFYLLSEEGLATQIPTRMIATARSGEWKSVQLVDQPDGRGVNADAINEDEALGRLIRQYPERFGIVFGAAAYIG